MRRNLDPLLDAVKRLVAVQAEARALGLFVGDHELLTCLRCGLMEDVTFAGLLITCRPTALGEDTGLRFEELSAGKFHCPSCGAMVIEPPEEPARKTLRARKRKPRK
ncbi:MAG: hypothetical protein HYY93_15060 [Planctomycetes bacterium]|nr:hypothetical protein [Planctomycetota bacterium]